MSTQSTPSTPAGGETALARLLSDMDPELDPATYLFLTVPPGVTAPDVTPVVTVVEAEGTTLVVDRRQLTGTELTQAELDEAQLGASAPMARLTLRVHSSLEAVGLTAAVATALSAAGISCNVVAGYHHDHVFVPTARAEDARSVLLELSRDGGAAEGLSGRRDG